MSTLRLQSGGTGDQLLVLLHGLGATGDVWHGWTKPLGQLWPGRWVAPDLPGHGGSAAAASYSFDGVAASLAGVLDPGKAVVILGHSLGGVIGLALAGPAFRLPVRAVIGVGIKVTWTEDEVARAQLMAQRPVNWFSTRFDAAARYLRVSGLAGLIDVDDPIVDHGLRCEPDRPGPHWRLAMDQATFAFAAPDMPGLLAASSAPVVLARGEHDHMVSETQLTELGAPTVTLPGLGHNAHVEDPDAVAKLVAPYC